MYWGIGERHRRSSTALGAHCIVLFFIVICCPLVKDYLPVLHVTEEVKWKLFAENTLIFRPIKWHFFLTQITVGHSSISCWLEEGQNLVCKVCSENLHEMYFKAYSTFHLLLSLYIWTEVVQTHQYRYIVSQFCNTLHLDLADGNCKGCRIVPWLLKRENTVVSAFSLNR